ncbi:hypothetical protein ACKWTF_010704 [Chironomus riparius]
MDFKDSKTDHRKGSEQDIISLRMTFETNLKFEFHLHENFTVLKIKDELENLSKREFDDEACLVIVLMTHGSNDGLVSAVDENFDKSLLWENFTDERCPSLAGKPRLIFLQTCRGNIHNNGCELGSNSNDPPSSCANNDSDSNEFKFKLEKNNFAQLPIDFFVGYATIEGFFSLRVWTGSFFVQSLCIVINENPGLIIDLIMAKVNERVANERILVNPTENIYLRVCQQPIFRSNLTKMLKFK